MALLVAIGLLALPTTARADQAKLQARELHEQGQRAYDNGDYETALVHFEAAYRVKPLTGFLFNLGQCHRNLGNLALALEHFQAYLDQGGQQQALVKELIKQVEQDLAARRASSLPGAAATTSAELPASKHSTDTRAEPAATAVPVGTPAAQTKPPAVRPSTTAAKETAPDDGAWLWWTVGIASGAAIVAAITGGSIYYVATMGVGTGDSLPSLGRADLRQP